MIGDSAKRYRRQAVEEAAKEIHAYYKSQRDGAHQVGLWTSAGDSIDTARGRPRGPASGESRNSLFWLQGVATATRAFPQQGFIDPAQAGVQLLDRIALSTG